MKLVSLSMTDHAVDGQVRPPCARPGLHDLFDSAIRQRGELFVSKQTQDDAFFTHRNCHVPSRAHHSLFHATHALIQRARWDISSRQIADPGRVRPLALIGKIIRQPVLFARDVVQDLREPQRFEPARGSWAQVSLVVVAVDDDGGVLLESGDSALVESC